MASNFDEEQKALQEKREILKLKQGLLDVEESEMIGEMQAAPVAKPKGMKAVENFFYHYKWHVIGFAFVAMLVGIMVGQAVTQKAKDLYVLVISTKNASGLYMKSMTEDLENALERYCPDFDNNGYVHVGVNYINLSTETGRTQLSDVDNYKFSAEMNTGDSQFFIADTGVMDKVYQMLDGEGEFFVDLTEIYPDAVLHEGKGLQLNTTGFIDEARWKSCPDMVGIYVRDVFAHMTGNNAENDEQRERALIVLDNIVKGNVVNPPKEEK